MHIRLSVGSKIKIRFWLEFDFLHLGIFDVALGTSYDFLGFHICSVRVRNT